LTKLTPKFRELYSRRQIAICKRAELVPKRIAIVKDNAARLGVELSANKQHLHDISTRKKGVCEP